MSIKVVQLKKDFEKAAADADREFFEFDPNKTRPWLAIYLKDSNVTIFCPLRTVKNYSKEFQKKYGEAVIEVENRPGGQGLLDFRKSFIGDFKENFFHLMETKYRWQKAKREEIYAKAESLQRGILKHSPDHDVRHLSLFAQTMERIKLAKRDDKDIMLT